MTKVTPNTEGLWQQRFRPFPISSPLQPIQKPQNIPQYQVRGSKKLPPISCRSSKVLTSFAGGPSWPNWLGTCFFAQMLLGPLKMVTILPPVDLFTFEAPNPRASLVPFIIAKLTMDILFKRKLSCSFQPPTTKEYTECLTRGNSSA